MKTPKPQPIPKYFKAEQGLFTPKEIKQVRSLGALGCTVEEVAVVFNISKATMERRMAQQPEIYEALVAGRVNSKIQVRRAAYQMATSGKHPTMTQYWLNCRDGWRSGENGGGVTVNVDVNGTGVQTEIMAEVMGMSDEEMLKEYESIAMSMQNGSYQMNEE